MSNEFTGERVIPGQVDINLYNEHFARYAFAANARVIQVESEMMKTLLDIKT